MKSLENWSDMCAGRIMLVSMRGQEEGQANADLGARTPIAPAELWTKKSLKCRRQTVSFILKILINGLTVLALSWLTKNVINFHIIWKCNPTWDTIVSHPYCNALVVKQLTTFEIWKMTSLEEDLADCHFAKLSSSWQLQLLLNFV